MELLYSLDPDVWGRGLATEAARVVLDHVQYLGRVVPYTNPGTSPPNAS